ncbi:MAG: SDR family oxidoreductase [Anaerolineae bacterium]|jgi:3-oxoacyl-[acyl-carrier protein] reductase
MDLKLNGRVALVSAASKGLGKAAAWALAREGADLVIAARGEVALAQTAAEIRADTGRAVLAVMADVSQAADIERLAEQAQARFGRVDVLVNNAGGPRPGLFAEMSDEDWLGAVELNLLSAVRLTRAVLPGMQARRWGRIINMTSIAVKQPLSNLILSNTARAGLVAMAKTLAGQVAAQGITVNNVCPGYMLTDRVRGLAEATATAEGITIDEAIARNERAIPMKRMGRPEELAALIAFLASEQAGYLTGATIQVDGGLYQGLM